jgi:CRISPR-associated protein Csd1
MILQALANYYDRKSADPEGGIAPPGFEYKEIPFVIVLDKSGNILNIEDTRQIVKKKLRAFSYLVPQGEKRSSGVKAYVLWDNLEYVLGIAAKGKPARVAQQHSAFIARIESLDLDHDAGVNAVLRFLKKSPHLSLSGSDHEEEIRLGAPFMSFRLNTDAGLVCQRKEVIDRIRYLDRIEGNKEFCLVAGREDVAANLQPAIKGVRGTNTTGGNVVSFNLPAFSSFGKEQGANAPMGEKASFAYTTALNHLLGKDSSQKIQVGDTTTVFWSGKKNHMEDDFSVWFEEPPKDDPDKLTDKVKALLKSLDTGTLPVEDNETPFFILGLSPNAARISVRFWHAGTVSEFSNRFARHFRDLEIVHAPYQRDHFSIWRLLCSVATLGKSENIPPNLAGEWMRAILNGSPYPETLFQSAIRRIRAEREVTYERAGIVKACLNRKLEFQNQPERKITVSLDEENVNSGYRIGRVFAVLEKIQQEANPSINATIKDKFYSAASGTPASVFPILLRTKNHHLGKLEKGREIYFEKLLGEVFSKVAAEGFPSQLSLADQGRFAIGYYHQRQAFFNKSKQAESTNTEQGE